MLTRRSAGTLRLLQNTLMAIVLVACSSASIGQQGDAARIAGVFHGQVLNGGDFDPVTTTFSISSDGRLVGEYSAADETGIVQGRVSNPVFEDAYTVSMEWTDKYGEGYAQFVFSADYSSFDGYWGDHDSESMHPWSGVRE